MRQGPDELHDHRKLLSFGHVSNIVATLGPCCCLCCDQCMRHLLVSTTHIVCLLRDPLSTLGFQKAEFGIYASAEEACHIRPLAVFAEVIRRLLMFGTHSMTARRYWSWVLYFSMSFGEGSLDLW